MDGLLFKIPTQALAGEAQWFECQPANVKVAGLIPSQGTCLGYDQVSSWVGCERQPMFLSLSFSLPSPLSKSK